MKVFLEMVTVFPTGKSGCRLSVQCVVFLFSCLTFSYMPEEDKYISTGNGKVNFQLAQHRNIG